MEGIEGLDKVIITTDFDERKGLVIRIKPTDYGKDYYIEPRGNLFQPLSNGISVIRITSLDIDKGVVQIKLHRKHINK